MPSPWPLRAAAFFAKIVGLGLYQVAWETWRDRRRARKRRKDRRPAE